MVISAERHGKKLKLSYLTLALVFRKQKSCCTHEATIQGRGTFRLISISLTFDIYVIIHILR